MKTFIAGALAALIFAATPVLAGTKVTVDTTKPGPKISRHIFGQFAEHLGTGIYDGIWVGPESPIPNTRGIRNDVVAALKEIKVPNIRWPGGCYADDYYWRNGIGPREDRPKTVNYLWGRVGESNEFGTHEFMDFIEQIDSSAYMSGNVGSGTPREMSDWLEYMTADPAISSLAAERVKNGHPEPFKVPFFGVGNESWGCGGSMTPEHYANEYRKYATFARNYDNAQQLPNGDFDPNGMKRIASGANVDDYKWTEVMMQASTQQIFSWTMDGLSLHYYSGYDAWPPHYPAENFGDVEYTHVIRSALKMDELVAKHSAIMDKYDPQKKVMLVVDEWGTWHLPAEGSNPRFLHQQNSQRDAIVAAVTINIFTRHAERVRMANIAQMVNVLQAMILTKGEKMVLTPTYHVFKLYVPFQDATVLPVSYDAGSFIIDNITLPRLDVAAARGTDGKVYVSLTNVHPKDTMEIDLASLGFTAKAARGETLVAPAIDSINTFDKPNTVTPKPVSVKASGGKMTLKLAPASVTVVVLE